MSEPKKRACTAGWITGVRYELCKCEVKDIHRAQALLCDGEAEEEVWVLYYDMVGAAGAIKC